jgi:bud site selection protein 20
LKLSIRFCTKNRTHMPKKHIQHARSEHKGRIRRTRAIFGHKAIDQIQLQMASQKPIPYDPELPGCGQFYCYECDRHFISEYVLKEHKRAGPHKKRAREVKQAAHSQKDAEWAVGLT